MTFMEYLNSYNRCAINLIPADEARELVKSYPDVFGEKVRHAETNIRRCSGHIGFRFSNAQYINCKHIQNEFDQYETGDEYGNECAIDFNMLDAFALPDFSEADISALL